MLYKHVYFEMLFFLQATAMYINPNVVSRCNQQMMLDDWSSSYYKEQYNQIYDEQ